LPAEGLVLELASGSGEHVVHFAQLFPSLTWQPSDPDPDALGSIAAWARDAKLPNIAQPIAIDARTDDWGIKRADAICCINMVHISPWEATEGVIRGAARLLPTGGPLYLYGPYLRSDVATAASNLAFDRSLKAHDPAWGLRHVDDVRKLARDHGLIFHGLTDMPANNISLIFRKAA
jgi:hypothetical protein